MVTRSGARVPVVASLMLATALAAVTAPVALGADRSTIPPCRVRNVTQDTSGRSLIRMVEKAEDGDRLRVRGTCSGEVVIESDIVISGVDDTAVMTGRGERRVVRVSGGANARLRGLRIRGGRVRGSDYGDDYPRARGAGVLNRGDLRIVDTIIRRNRASYYGGGIFNAGNGSLTLNDSEVAANRGFAGGGISNRGRLELVRSTLRANKSPRAGGGIDMGGTVDLIDSLVVGNTARNEGGGVYIHSAGVLTLTGSHVTRNTAGDSGGGIYNGHDAPRWTGTVTLDAGSSVTDNVPDDCVGTPAC